MQDLHGGEGANRIERAILDAMPLPVLVMNGRMAVVDCNEAGRRMLRQHGELLLRHTSGELLRCVHTFNNPQGCGHSQACQDCVVRRVVAETLSGQRLVRKQARLEVESANEARKTELLLTSSPFAYGHETCVLLIIEDVTELMTLRQLLPICARCKKIRDDRQYWHRLEEYMSANLHIDLTHGYCPDCLKYYLDELERDMPQTPPR